MKRLAMFLVPLLVFTIGCKRAMRKLEDDAKPGADEKPKIVPSGSGNLSGSGGAAGGGQGAAQAVRNAAARSINDQQLHDLRLSIAKLQSENTSGNPPGADEIKEEIRQNGKLVLLIKDEVIILTNTDKRDGIVAYTKWPQQGGKHSVLTAGTNERVQMTPTDLKKALEDQKSPVTLEK